MDVSVHSKRGQLRLRFEGVRSSILGDGMLERARATSLALLGATAAVGLAIVALALNQGWPLIAGSSIPPIPPRHQAVGEATVVAGPGVRADPSGVTVDGADGSGGSASNGDPGQGSGGLGAGSAPAGSTELVVSPSAPSEPRGGGSHEAPGDAGQPLASQPTPAVNAAPVTPPPAEPASPSAPPAGAIGQPDSPATTAGTGEESNVPSWSNGKGHAYGRSDDVDEGQDHAWDADRDRGGDDPHWDGDDHD
jgi:hypothetical protein